MSIFKNIDPILIETSKRLNAKLSKDRPHYPEALRTFEERRIDWLDNEINKAIIIQPTFEVSGVDSSLWNFVNLAWTKKNGVAQKPGWSKNLVLKEDFDIIEKSIDKLIDESIRNLQCISIADVVNK